MKVILLMLLSITVLSCAGKSANNQVSKKPQDKAVNKIAYAEGDLVQNARQLILTGKRSGEGYFSQDGSLMIYQSEKDELNPFYQIYMMDLKNGDSWKVTPGHGKTSCGWIHPNKKQVMFSSTHEDKNSIAYQKKELDFRKSGKKRRYSWDYDENYEIYVGDLKGNNLKNVTKTLGYDAEGSFSPDGKYIAFASNRHAYSDKLSKKDNEKFKQNASYMMDIYIMRSDGSDVRRLTTHKGYDGGPFFSPDGKKIVWRRFASHGHTAEIFTMNTDGSQQKQITKINNMSWAPFYHPSGDYIIFNTNKHGYGNFELYIVDSEGSKKPVRVSFTKGFDGLPVFTNDGQHLSWTTQRTSNGQSQIFYADWNDTLARKLLGLSPRFPNIEELSPEIKISESKAIVEYLASASLKGRLTGSKEEEIYTNKISQYFDDLKLSPIQGSQNYILPFDFDGGGQLGADNNLSLIVSGTKQDLALSKQWRPLAYSKSGRFRMKEFAFAGYGLVIPEGEGFKSYSSFENVDVKNKWVFMFRSIPENIDGKKRSYYFRYSQSRFKVKAAERLGAKGVVFISGPQSKFKNSLLGWRAMDTSAPTSIPVISLGHKTAEQIFSTLGHDVAHLQKNVDEGKNKNISWSQNETLLKIDIKSVKKKGLNVVALLKVPGAKDSIMIGAHADHLGEGRKIESSLATSTDKDLIHYGADDNASGVSGVLELAHYFAKNKSKLKSNVYFALWSAEEIGVIGSKKYIDTYLSKNKIKAYLNMDMIGRMKDHVYVQGVGSSDSWNKLIERSSFRAQLPVKLQKDPYLPTDSMSFYLSKVPGLSLFTGVHTDYHTPRDTPDKLNYKGLKKITVLVKELAEATSNERVIAYKKVERAKTKKGKRSFRIYLGTIPDYAAEGVKGLKLSGVIKGGPADKGGLQKDDLIVEFSGQKIKNIYDYMYILESAKIGVSLSVTVIRNGTRVSLKVTPESKQ
ncbi:MAG: M20/M25/M40 family metallo-hydrolase [Bdellovibrionaceae bacterium]|jgi:Tol biopolymer transport system component|nr:M20/M25/M40 family metallo-hydrolase [Pseudobdellovibrionaceae bacterium]